LIPYYCCWGAVAAAGECVVQFERLYWHFFDNKLTCLLASLGAELVDLYFKEIPINYLIEALQRVQKKAIKVLFGYFFLERTNIVHEKTKILLSLRALTFYTGTYIQIRVHLFIHISNYNKASTEIKKQNETLFKRRLKIYIENVFIDKKSKIEQIFH
jgi:hypothetical protein